MKKNYKEYKTLDKHVDQLYEDENFDQALRLLEKSYSDFPEYDFDMKLYSLVCYRQLKNYDKCIDLLLEGLSKGFFYGLHWKTWDPLKGFSQWTKIEKLNRENREITQKRASMEFKVLTPLKYDEKKSYPLFITLHGDGNGCNIEDFSQEWQATQLLQKDFIVAYVQSSQTECTGGFGWTSNYDQSRKEINEAYLQICEEYPIDRNLVLIGGFSGGAMAALNLMMNDTFPIKGIMALCPSETDDCNEDNIRRAAERESRMVLLEGDKSSEIPFQQELMITAKKQRLPIEYIINKGVAHRIPEDFDKTIDKAVDFLMK